MVHCTWPSQMEATTISTPSPKNWLINAVSALLMGSISSGNTTFCTREELPRMVPTALFTDSA